MDSLTAKANVGTGTDQLAGVSTASGFVGAITLTDEFGSPLQTSNGVAVRVVAITASASLARTSTSGATSSGAFNVAFLNAGNADATVAGGTLKPGEEVSFSPPSGGILSAISYDGTGTELVISEVNSGAIGGGGS